MLANETVYMKNNVLEMNNIESLLKYIKSEKDNFISWQSYINEQVQLRGCSYERFGKMTGFSKNTIKSWCRSGTMPRTRDTLIKLAFGLKMGLEETNELLVKYGKFSELYAKDLYDAIVIYVIVHRQGNWDDECYNYESIKRWNEKFEELLAQHRVNPKYFNEPKTTGIFDEIKQIKEDSEFEEFVIKNQDVFFSSYSGLICFIDDFIEIRLDEKNDFEDSSSYSWHRYISEKGLDSSFEIMLSRLKHNGILPRREQLIALGIHLNMVVNDINKMLSLAHMKELYARDIAESLVIYLLKNAEEVDPDLQLNNAWKLVMTTDDNKLKKEYKQVIDRYYSLDSEDWDEEGIEDLSEYIGKMISDNELDTFSENIINLTRGC